MKRIRKEKKNVEKRKRNGRTEKDI